jgi:hypothetical protein
LTGESVPLDPYGTATASSISLFSSNIVLSATGSFAGVVPVDGVVMSLGTGGAGPTIGGLSTTPTTVSLNNFFVFSQQDTFGGYQASGTSPVNRFEFNLETLTEDSYDSGTGQALFTGTGTIIDITGGYQETAADLTVTFSGPGSPSPYTFSVEAVPEPATMSLAAAGLLGLLAWRRPRA